MAEIIIDVNFGLGVLTGWGTAYALYRARHFLAGATESVTQRASTAQEFAKRTADARYINDLIRYIQKDHLAGEHVALSDILIEPQFIPAQPLLAPRDEELVREIFHVVPIVPDYPYLHAAYNIPTMSIAELNNGTKAVVLLGEVGSGRTTALHTIALWSLGVIKFDPPVDVVQERLDQEVKFKKEAQHAQSYKERITMDDLAKDAIEKSKAGENQSAPKATNNLSFKQLTPMYAHLAHVALFIEKLGREIDPAEPIVRALQTYTGYVTSKTMPRNIYERLGEGKALLLLDGYDELSVYHQSLVNTWLGALLRQYGDNFIIITANPHGYGQLMHIGFSPVFLRPLSDTQANALIDKWATHWGKIARRRADIPSVTLERVRDRNRAYTPLELSAKIWAMFDSPERESIGEWLEFLGAQYLGNMKPEKVREQLGRAALLQLEEGFITVDRLDQILRGIIIETPISTDDDTNEEEWDNIIEGDEAPESKAKPEKVKSAEKSSASHKELLRFLQALEKDGMLRAFDDDKYQFKHPMLAMYFASLVLPDFQTEELLALTHIPIWRDALALTNLHHPLEDLVTARLAQPLDVLYNTHLELARWLKYAGKVEWRAGVLKVLGNAFVQANQYPLVRERIAAALVGTRDKNVMRIFARGLRDANPDVRRLSCLGLGALRADEAIRDITTLLADVEPDVALSAGLALGAIGTQNALEEMVGVLTTASEALRQAVAEAFAALPKDGYPVLYDAISHEDLMVRRAAVFGLRRINTAWALVAVYKASTEDDEWYVRSAAEQAFLEMQFGETATGVKAIPHVESLEWLRDWIASLGDAAKRITVGGDALLRKALEEGDVEIQALSVANIGQLGIIHQADALYAALRHREPVVRAAAHLGLCHLQAQLGMALPAPL
jgi:HEAT repeat protein